MHPRYLKRRHRRHPIDGPWIIFEGGGRRTQRRRKTAADLAVDESGRKLREFREEIMREYIRESMFGPSRPVDLLALAQKLRDEGEMINLPAQTVN